MLLVHCPHPDRPKNMAYFNATPDMWDKVNSPVAGLCVSNVFKPKRHLITISRSCSLNDLLQTLKKHSILSAPVVGDDGKVEGIVDVMDVLLALVARFSSEKEKLGDDKAVKDFFETPVGEVEELQTGFLKEFNPVFDDKAHVEHDGKLPDLLNLMWGGWHRVPITKDGAIIDFVTQSDVLQFMVNHMRLILGDTAAAKTIDELDVGTRKLTSVKCTDTAWSVLCKMCAAQVSAVPVLSSGDVQSIFATFSASDLRCITQDNILDLNLSVLDFLDNNTYQNREYFFPANILGMPGFLTAKTVKGSDTLELVMYKMAALRLHRLWLVDDKNCPIGVISIGDLMKVFLFGGEV